MRWHCGVVLAAAVAMGNAAAAEPETQSSKAGAMPAAADPDGAEVMMTLIQRAREALFVGPSPTDEEVRAWVKDQRPDGSWPDVDYAATGRSHWATAVHLSRACGLARRQGSGDKYRRDPSVVETLRRAVRFWCDKRFQCPNWWYNEINIPQIMADLLLMAGDLLTGDERRDALSVVRQTALGRTGQNRVWQAAIVYKRALLEDDAETVAKAVAELMEEVRVAPVEGIRADGAFHQHGAQIQFGNYGAAFLNSVTLWLDQLRGTPHAPTPEKRAVLRHAVLDGFQWILWRGRMDLQAQGRQLAPGSQRQKAVSLAYSIHRMKAFDGAAAADYDRIRASTLKEETAGPVGNRMFWNSDFMVHRTDAFHASLRMNSLRVLPVEDYINRDLALGRYFSDGALLVMRTGDEYRDLAACWDWTRIPGTTLPAMPVRSGAQLANTKLRAGDPPLFTLNPNEEWRRKGESAFTGGVSDGRAGAAVHTQDLDGVKAKKAYFFVGGRIVCLGAEITSVSPYPVATTLNQCLADGSFRKENVPVARGCVVTRGEHGTFIACFGRDAPSTANTSGQRPVDSSFRQGNGWVAHGGIVYYGDHLVARTAFRDGDWRYVQGSLVEPRPDRKEVFTLTIEHGVKPTDASYVYAIAPGTDPETAPASGVEVLANNGTVQAVRGADGTRLMIFHAPGTLEDFTTAIPGAFILRDGTIHAADPSHALKGGRVELAGQTVELTFPDGQESGKTVVVTVGR